MSNYAERDDTIVFHPGYYINELMDESGLTLEEFAEKIGVDSEKISLLVRGEQNMSIGIATKLSDLLGTSVEYWINLQNAFDT